MQVQHEKENKIAAAMGAGALVWVVAALADFALLPLDRSFLVRQVVANFIGGLMAVAVVLAIQLRHEQVHYKSAIGRAAIVAELNHHVRNAMFPLCIAVQKLGDPEAKSIADDAVERINLALRDATADALAGRVDYTITGSSEAKG